MTSQKVSITSTTFAPRVSMGPLLFLLKLAWDCRYRLPLLITVGFMVLDIRMQLDINVQMRNVPRPRTHRHYHRPLPGNNDHLEHEDNGSDSSWTTLDEEELTDVDSEDLNVAAF